MDEGHGSRPRRHGAGSRPPARRHGSHRRADRGRSLRRRRRPLPSRRRVHRRGRARARRRVLRLGRGGDRGGRHLSSERAAARPALARRVRDHLRGRAGARLRTRRHVRLPSPHLRPRERPFAFPVGALARSSTVPGRPELAGGLTWIPAREDVDYRLRNSWRLGERVRLGLYATSAVVSNEEWIRPTWYNSLAHFVAGDDVRNHYDSRELGLELEWMSPEPPVWEDAPRWRLVVSGGHEEAESLVPAIVTVLFGGRYDQPGRVVRAAHHQRGSFWFARAGFEWSMNRRVDGRTAFGSVSKRGFEDELGSDSGNLVSGGAGASGSYDFLLLEGRIVLCRVTSWGHAVDAFAIGRADLAGNLPLQRHSTLGGVGTLPTMPLRGPVRPPDDLRRSRLRRPSPRRRGARRARPLRARQRRPASSARNEEGDRAPVRPAAGWRSGCGISSSSSGSRRVPRSIPTIPASSGSSTCGRASRTDPRACRRPADSSFDNPGAWA